MRRKCRLSLVNWCILVAALIVCMNMKSRAMADITQDYEALVGFMRSADPKGLLQSNWSGKDPCANNWDGVLCTKGRVWHVILESRQLGGYIADNTLSNLDQLRKISLKNNMLSGPIPTFLSPYLRCIWLTNNSFDGPIPDIFSRTRRFNKLDLSFNKLISEIPPSLASLDNLNTLLLNHNQLLGSIPPFDQASLLFFDVSDNNLSGPIPNTSKLQTSFKSESYMNNPGLCGPPSPFQCQGTEVKKKAKSNVVKILLIVVADVVAVLFMSLLAVYCYKKIHKRRKSSASSRTKDFQVPSVPATLMSIDETGKTYDKATRNEEMTDAEKSKLVVFHRPGRISFDLEELLQASAEVLGKGCFGTAYKAVFGRPNGRFTVVVKRLREMQSAGKQEFDRQMLVLGQLRHPNIVQLLAYYYAKDEKFLVTEYAAYGSLFSLLHGSDPGRVPLHWDARLRIARGVARGMAYLHRSLKTQEIPHGNLKSTNILVGEGMEAKVADFGMAPLLTQSGAQCMVAFKVPEYTANKAINSHADVYSFGIILLELLTGQVSILQGEGGVDLPKWVSSKLGEADTNMYAMEVATEAREGEKEALLEVAIKCVGVVANEMPTMQEALKMVEAIHMEEDIGSPNAYSYVSQYDTPTYSNNSRRSSFQDFMSPPFLSHT